MMPPTRPAASSHQRVPSALRYPRRSTSRSAFGSGAPISRATLPAVPREEREDPAVADHVEPHRVGDDPRVAAALEDPKNLAGARVETVRPPTEARDVDDAVDHDGRARDR